MARKILLADDSVTAQNMGRKILSEAGYEVVTVNNGAAALKKVAELKPDLIVLDVYMPGYGGLEVCQRVKESADTARIPILLTVGKLEPFKADEARRVRADAHIIKPFEASELLTAISKLEDRIVPQGQAKKFGRATRKSAIEPDGSELQDGWRDRLPKPIAKEKRGSAAAKSESASDEPKSNVIELRPAAATAPEPQSAEAANNAPAAEEQKPAASTSSAVSEPGQATEPSHEAATQAIEAPVTASETKSETSSAPTSHLAENEVAEVLSALIPVQPGAHDASFAGPGTAGAGAPVLAGPRWIAEEVPVSEEESNIDLEQEMAKFYALANGRPEVPAQSASPAATVPSLDAFSGNNGHTDLADADRLICELQPQQTEARAIAEPQFTAEDPNGDTSSSAEITVQPPVSTEQPRELAYAAAASTGGAFDNAALSEIPMTPGLSGESSNSTWPNWDQVRDSLLHSENIPEALVAVAQCDDSRHEPASSPASDSAKAAVNATDAQAIASIVDSVLADLKPKLIEEIARRMGKFSADK